MNLWLVEVTDIATKRQLMTDYHKASRHNTQKGQDVIRQSV